MQRARRVPVAMTIAGSDSGGGAGIQADLKTFAALGVYGTSVLTAITAQNTLRVTAIHEVPSDIVVAQIEAVMDDIEVDAVKTGMLSSSAIINAVAEVLEKRGTKYLIVDPVMVAKSGDRLLREDAVEAMRSKLIPLATVVTPNLPEAEVLTDMKINSRSHAREAAKRIVALGAKSVVIKGGHSKGPAVDIFYNGKDFRLFEATRIKTTSTHGTGCTFASAIAAGLAKGLTIDKAIAQAKDYVTNAIQNAFPLGHGHGPLNHFYRWWR